MLTAGRRTDELVLMAAAESGALAAFLALHELELFARDRVFTTREVEAHALSPENRGLRVAFVNACGGVSPRKVGKLLSRLEGRYLGGLRVSSIGTCSGGLLWRVFRE